MTALAAKHDPTPAFARQVIGLYRDEALAQARFPDLDLEVLQVAEQALLAAQLEVERCEAQLEAARVARDQVLAQLEAKVERAVAYARVFAAGDPALSARLAELGRKKPAAASGERAPPLKRGRPKKHTNGAEQFGVPALAADGGGERDGLPV